MGKAALKAYREGRALAAAAGARFAPPIPENPIRDRETLAYLGGLFDGEGCVSVTSHTKAGRTYYTRSLIFTQSLLESCTLFRDTLGVGRIYTCPPRVSTGGCIGRVTIYQWRANGGCAVAAAELLLPFLRIKRAELIEKFGVVCAEIAA